MCAQGVNHLIMKLTLKHFLNPFAWNLGFFILVKAILSTTSRTLLEASQNIKVLQRNVITRPKTVLQHSDASQFWACEEMFEGYSSCRRSTTQCPGHHSISFGKRKGLTATSIPFAYNGVRACFQLPQGKKRKSLASINCFLSTVFTYE